MNLALNLRLISAEWLQPRDDLLLILASTESNLKDIRMMINEIPNWSLGVFTTIGFVLHTQSALHQAANLASVYASHNVPPL